MSTERQKRTRTLYVRPQTEKEEVSEGYKLSFLILSFYTGASLVQQPYNT